MRWRRFRPTRFSTSADVRQTLFSFKLGKALEAAANCQAGRRAGGGARPASDVARRDPRRITSCCSRSSSCASFRPTRSRSRRISTTRATAGRLAWRPSSKCLRAEVDLENARAEERRAENEVATARATLNTVMVRPTNAPIHPTDTLRSCRSMAEFEAAVKEAHGGKARAAVAADAGTGSDPAGRRRRGRLPSQASTSTGRAALPCDARKTCSILTTRAGRRRSTLKVPLFDGWRTAGRVAQARAERNTVTQQIAALESQVRLEVQYGARRAGARRTARFRPPSSTSCRPAAQAR